MKKLILGITAIVISLVFFSCPDDSGNGEPVIPNNPDEKTIIVFDNTYGICTVLVYKDYRRMETDKIVEIPAGRTSDELEWMPSASMPFYFAYRITLKGVSGFAVDFVPEVGKDQKAVRIDAGKRTVVPIPVLDDAVSSEQQVLSPKSYLSISNNSNYSFQLYNGVSMIRPDNFPDSGVVNSGERAPYTINTGRSSDFRLLVGADYKPFPDTPERFEAGNFYSYQYNNSVSLDAQIPITLDNTNMPMYSVSFSANGGSGTVPAAQTVRLASVITLPLGSGLTNGDKVFGGWGIDASGTGVVYSAGTTYTVTRDIILYAQWYPAGALYTVTFNSAGGKAAASQSMVSGALAMRPPDPYRAGYTFTGWYRDTGRQNYYDFETPVTESFTLYAAWDANKYTVTFNANGADGTAPAAVTVDYGSSITLPGAGGLSKPDETFRGWNTEDDGTETAYASGAQYTVNADVTLFAMWGTEKQPPVNPDPYTVTSGADSGPGTLRYAIENAEDGSTITIDSNVGIIALTGNLAVNKSVTIEGNGVTLTRSTAWTVVDHNSQLVSSGSWKTVTISRVHFKDGRATAYGGAISNSYGNMTLKSCIFSGNQNTDSSGGAIFNYGTLTIKGCTFYENSNSGGVVYNNGTITLEGNLFYGNGSAVRNVAPVTSRGYNVVDVPFGTGSNQCGWPAVIGDKNISDLPFSTTTFRLLPGSGAANVITTRPADYPTVDFYGNPIPASGAAAGAVQATVSGGGYYLDLTVNNASHGTVRISPDPGGDELLSGMVILTANANTGYEFSYWLVDEEQSGSANPLTLTMTKHTKVQAIFGRVVLVTNFNDDMYSETTVGTLRNALANAQDWDIIRFSGVTPGTSVIALYYYLPMIYNKSITIEGNGITLTRGSWTTIDGQSQLLRFSKSTVAISRVHFKDGRARAYGGAIDNEDGTLILESCIFSGNQNYNSPGGGAITHRSEETLIVKGCTFYGNSGNSVGVIDVLGRNTYETETLTLAGNLFYENTAPHYPILYYWLGTVVSNGYNVVDVPYGTGSTQAGWKAATGDTTFTDLGITGIPINTATFAPVSGLGSVIPNPPPQGFPATDFYGNARTFPGAPGAVSVIGRVSIENVADIGGYLAAQTGGTSTSNPINLVLSLQLTETNCNVIFEAISTAGKYVNLDLSACTRSGNSSGGGLRSDGMLDLINNTYNNPGGKDRIVSFTFPETATSTLDGSYAWGHTFGFFENIESVNLSNVTRIGDATFYNRGLTSVTIGANVILGSDSFYNTGFENAYNNTYGKAAGTYTRPNTSTTTWTKQ